MIKFIGSLLHILGLYMLFSGAIVAFQQANMSSADHLLVGISLVAAAVIITKLSETYGQNRQSKSTMPGPDKV